MFISSRNNFRPVLVLVICVLDDLYTVLHIKVALVAAGHNNSHEITINRLLIFSFAPEV